MIKQTKIGLEIDVKAYLKDLLCYFGLQKCSRQKKG